MIVKFPKEKWPVADLKTAAVATGDMEDDVWVTGKIGLNEDHLAHISPIVSGIVRSVPARLGEHVEKGQQLAIIDSKEVGNAKLTLLKERFDVKAATAEAEWQKTIYANTQLLIAALGRSATTADIEKALADKPMGDYRQQLMTAYVRRNQTAIDLERIRGLSTDGVTSGRQLIAAQSDAESAEASFRSLVEQIKFSSNQEKLLAEQRLQSAKTAEAVSESALVILGFSPAAIAAMDPIAEQEKVAFYPVLAPFTGIVIEKDAVLSELKGPGDNMFTIADLATVWVQADIFEEHIPDLMGLPGKKIAFRCSSYPNKKFAATVFYTGDVVDQKTRSLRLRAVVDNPERLLKPGMFVDVRIPYGARSNVVRVPEDAVMRDDKVSYVFVYRDGDQFERRNVDIGETDEEYAEVRTGLKVGEQVVVKGGFALKSEMLRSMMADED